MFCNHRKKHQLNTPSKFDLEGRSCDHQSIYRECKVMRPSILQYSPEFDNLFWNHPTFSTMKKSEFLVDCLDSFWMTASMSSILQNACYDPSKWIIDNWPNTIRTAFTLMGFKIFEWFFQLVIFCCTQRFCNNISCLELSPTTITVAKLSGLMDSFHERFQTSCVLSDCNWTQTQNHLVRKRTLNHLAKLVHIFLCSNRWICWWECSLSSDRNAMHP